MDVETFRKLLNSTDKIILLKFYADWCRPCNNIKELCNYRFSRFPSTIKVIEINIDETINLYVTLKRYKMIKSIPSLMIWYPQKERDHWYVPDQSISTSNKEEIICFLNNIDKKTM